MTDDKRLDDELVNLTDQVLAGKKPPLGPEMQEMADVVYHLREAITRPPAAHFQEQLARRLDQEWEKMEPQRPARSWWRGHSRMTQLAALAAVVVVALLGIVLLSSGQDDEPLSGTASGSVAGIIIVILVAGAASLLAFWVGQRRKS